MSIYRIHPDRMRYQLISVASKKVQLKLSETYPFHIDPTPKPYAYIWQPLEITFYDSTSSNRQSKLPNFTVSQGRLFLNATVYDALSKLIEADGEVLPVLFAEQQSTIFNPLKTTEAFDALNIKLSTKNEWQPAIPCFIENKRRHLILL